MIVRRRDMLGLRLLFYFFYMPGSIAQFMDQNFKHFNARETVDAANGWIKLLEKGDKMFLSMAGAMSTGEIGISLAKMIRAGKIHGISCTAANLEEDIFNLVAHNDYALVPKYWYLTPKEEAALRDKGFNRVTDTCIPESVMRHIEGKFIDYCAEAAEKGESYFPCEYFYRMMDEGFLDDIMEIPREHSWLIAAHEMGIPVYSPGWEDSTLGNIFTARVMEGKIKSHHAIRHGTEQFEHLINWYMKETVKHDVGFFQIGGGIAGDFSICSVPCILQDLKKKCKFWGYFAQISDSTTSYGSYSGAVPNEKITWWKLSPDCPKYMINSDASIVAPLIFQYILEKTGSAEATAHASMQKSSKALKRIVMKA